ncbi:glycoside hydrolase family 5 protein [Eubacterium xylanophilum]|uniref:glycoside hydrolase family 5 protein n=1 Tax=Eubacterium xylanophilum TaxID=39497 RepID=UPI00047871C3|nr:glycoside hydrolase family 5 protein [Eubacterium xylanophilum]
MLNKKKIITSIAFVVLTFGCCLLCISKQAEAKKPAALHVKGTNLVNSKGKKVVLKGVSTHGIAWFPDYVNKACFKSFKKMGANTIRLALYSDVNAGYNRNLYSKVDAGVKAATDLGMYVIIDWHILNDSNPKTNESEARHFFKYFTKKYGNYSNVLYEICNEPNGGATWENDIKPYAKRMIKLIRKNAKKAPIIVGTPTWSQDVDIVANSPIKTDKNLLYTIHFYAATHQDDLRNKVKTALSKGLPVFCSEFSICEASGNGRLDKKSAKAWKKLFNKYKIGRVAWSVCNKDEASALLKSSTKTTKKIKKKHLSKAGKWIMKNMI